MAGAKSGPIALPTLMRKNSEVEEPTGPKAVPSTIEEAVRAAAEEEAFMARADDLFEEVHTITSKLEASQAWQVEHQVKDDAMAETLQGVTSKMDRWTGGLAVLILFITLGFSAVVTAVWRAGDRLDERMDELSKTQVELRVAVEVLKSRQQEGDGTSP